MAMTVTRTKAADFINKSLAADIAGVDDPSSTLSAIVQDAHASGLHLDDDALVDLLDKLEEKKKEIKAAKRQAAEDARRERRGLPRKGEVTKEQQEKLDGIMSKVDADLVLTFLMMHKPATLIQTISQMERLEFPWNQEDDYGQGDEDE
jgi:hypothetical protein